MVLPVSVFTKICILNRVEMRLTVLIVKPTSWSDLIQDGISNNASITNSEMDQKWSTNNKSPEVESKHWRGREGIVNQICAYQKRSKLFRWTHTKRTKKYVRCKRSQSPVVSTFTRHIMSITNKCHRQTEMIPMHLRINGSPWRTIMHTHKSARKHDTCTELVSQTSLYLKNNTRPNSRWVFRNKLSKTASTIARRNPQPSTEAVWLNRKRKTLTNNPRTQHLVCHSMCLWRTAHRTLTRNFWCARVFEIRDELRLLRRHCTHLGSSIASGSYVLHEKHQAE